MDRARPFVPGLLILLILSVPALPALAGPNGGGTLLLHDAALTYTVDLGPDLCGMGASPASCASADSRIDGTYVPGNPPVVTPKVWKVYAAFLEGTRPRLKGVNFGIAYDSTQVTLTAHGPCVGNLEQGGESVPYLDWPAPGTGTSLVFRFTQTSPLVECYWFAGYAEAPSLFRLVEHPDPATPSDFLDDSVPPLHDPVIGFSTIGFDMEGEPACPDPSRQGACCDLKEGTCAVLTTLECDNLEYGSFLGEPSCDPNPCPTTGPCCLVQSGTCQVMTPQECRGGGNLFIGLAGQTCEDEPGSSCGAARLGACCGGEVCTVTSESDCAAPGFWIPLMPCYPGEQNPCLLTWGACCIDNQCYLYDSETCPSSGTFHPGVPCEPDGGPCASPVRRTTWGAVKHVFR